MSVSEMQACLARLYVNESFRKLFYLNPEETLRDYLLSEEEATAIREIDRKMLDFFAGSLRNKRKDGLVRAYPALFEITGIDRYYCRYYELHPASPHTDSYREAMDFGTFMEESLAGAEDVPAYASDTARYERLWYQTSFAPNGEDLPVLSGPPKADSQMAGLNDRLRRTDRLVVETFTYDIGALEEKMESARGSASVIEMDAGEHHYLFKPANHITGPKALRVNLPTKLLVGTCDGRQTVSEVIERMEQLLGASALEDALLSAMNRLMAAGALERAGD